MYIITKLNVKTNMVELVNQKQYKDKENALTEIFNNINTQTEKAYINKIKNEQYIEVYMLKQGVIYNSKELSHIYQILEIDDNY